MNARLWPTLAVAAFLVPALAGCFAPTPAAPCNALSLLRGGIDYLNKQADPDGGISNGNGETPNPRTTAWTLLAAGLARRSGQEGGFDAEPHVTWLKNRTTGMLSEGSAVDSAANNASLVRVALQVWGQSPFTVPVEDPTYPHATHLKAAWDARFDSASGRYGTRINEHLFASFAAWLFGPPDDTRNAMARYTEHLADNATAWTASQQHGAYGNDAWYAAYARIAVGPQPNNTTLDTHLNTILSNHQQNNGGVHGPDTSQTPDASTTAAALMAWRVDQTARTDPRIVSAIDYLCTLRAADGSIPFSTENAEPRAKTTAEVVIALALVEKPIPWGHPLPGAVA